MAKDKKQSSHFVAGAVFGTLLGGIAALLLAPKSGRETQEDLKGQAKKVMKTAEARLDEMEIELNEQIDGLKVAARDLRGEAYEESQRLITRAEMLKHDLQDSAARLEDNQFEGNKETATDAKRLVSEGQSVLSDLEKMTRKIMRSSTDHSDDNGEG